MDPGAHAFAQWEQAETFSQTTEATEPVLVLVRQIEWIDEPEPGAYAVRSGERLTEWAVTWLEGVKRGSTSIVDFLKHPRPGRTNPTHVEAR